MGIDIIRKEMDTERKGYEELIMRTLWQEGYNNLLQLSALLFLCSYKNPKLESSIAGWLA